MNKLDGASMVGSLWACWKRVCKIIYLKILAITNHNHNEKLTNESASSTEFFSIWKTGSLSMAWWLFGKMLQATGFPIVFELGQDGRTQFGSCWVTIIIVFRIIFHFHSIGILTMLILSNCHMWCTKIIAVRRAFQNNAICHSTVTRLAPLFAHLRTTPCCPLVDEIQTIPS